MSKEVAKDANQATAPNAVSSQPAQNLDPQTVEVAHHVSQVKRGAIPFNPALVLSFLAPLGEAALQAVLVELAKQLNIQIPSLNTGNTQ